MNGLARNYLFISGHDYRSNRKASVHFIAEECTKLGRVKWFSPGFSNLSIIKKDPREALSSQANTIVSYNGVDCFLWKTLIHPLNLKYRALSGLESAFFRIYRKSVPTFFSDWIEQADFVLVESGLPVIFIKMIKEINPLVHLIYIASDDVEVIGCSKFICDELSESACLFDGIRVPSRGMTAAKLNNQHIYFVPHGLDSSVLNSQHESPYGEGLNAVSVGSMLFDKSLFEIAAEAFPHITFHVIGGGINAQGLGGRQRPSLSRDEIR